MNEIPHLASTIQSADSDTLMALAQSIANSEDLTATGLIQALDDARVRRWVRQYLLRECDQERRSDLAERLLTWPDDLAPHRRDRSVKELVETLDDDQLQRHLGLLAGSNAAGDLWERIARSGAGAVYTAADQILEQGDVRARETTLHMLVLDPYGPGYLPHEMQDRLLIGALDDPDPEIRGLAAEVVAAELPETLLVRWESAQTDESERVRMAFWRAALVHQPDSAVAAAQQVVLDPEQALDARRTALLALGENAPTGDVAAVLQVVLRGDDQILAEDAAELMWRHHRTPDIANAAAESQFDDVRERANRLLHPEMGSPAAGGSRPGDPTRTQEIFQQITPRKGDQNTTDQ
jgi:hypothetical protein